MNPAKFNLSKYSNDSLRDFLLEVDLEYCKELQELQNYYRLASNKLEIKKRNVSDYYLIIAEDYLLLVMLKN